MLLRGGAVQRAGHGRFYYAVLDSISAELCKGCQSEEHGFVPPDCQLRKQRRRLDFTWVTHLTEEDSSKQTTICKHLAKDFHFCTLCASLSVRIVGETEDRGEGEKKQTKRQSRKRGKKNTSVCRMSTGLLFDLRA